MIKQFPDTPEKAARRQKAKLDEQNCSVIYMGNKLIYVPVKDGIPQLPPDILIKKYEWIKFSL